MTLYNSLLIGPIPFLTGPTSRRNVTRTPLADFLSVDASPFPCMVVVVSTDRDRLDWWQSGHRIDLLSI